jgi:hypothetical protein
MRETAAEPASAAFLFASAPNLVVLSNAVVSCQTCHLRALRSRLTHSNSGADSTVIRDTYSSASEACEPVLAALSARRAKSSRVDSDKCGHAVTIAANFRSDAAFFAAPVSTAVEFLV